MRARSSRRERWADLSAGRSTFEWDAMVEYVWRSSEASREGEAAVTGTASLPSSSLRPAGTKLLARTSREEKHLCRYDAAVSSPGLLLLF